MHLNGAGTALTGAAVTALDRGVRLRSAVQGPDGNLYVVTDGANGAGAIWKVVPVLATSPFDVCAAGAFPG